MRLRSDSTCRRGLLVLQVVPGGSAAKGGIKSGDVLLRYGGKDVTAVDQLSKLIEDNVGAKDVDVKVWRESEEIKDEYAPDSDG